MATDSLPTHASRSGLFGLSLNVSQTQDFRHLDYRIEVTKKLLRDFQDCGFTATAVRNLQGVFYFYQKRTSKALESFKYILDHDDSYNKNALANTLIVYQRLSRSSLAQQYDKKINELQKEDSYKKKEIKAISAAEQAFAYQFDCYVEEDELQRAYKSVPLYEESLCALQDMDEDQHADSKRRLEVEIRYWYAQCKLKMHNASYRRTKGPTLAEDPYTSAVSDLWNIAKSKDTHKVFKSGAWTYLGLFSSKKPRKESISSSSEICEELQQVLDSSEQCFQMALEFLETTEALIRYGTYLRMKGEFDKAIEYLEKAWDLDKSNGNWFALTSLAQTHLMKFSNRNSQGKEEEKKQHLKTAIELLEKCVEINATALDLSALGEAYHKKAKLDVVGTISPESDDAAKASEYFYQAVQSLGTEKKPEVHRRHGRFLKDIGEKRQAIESFKRAMEVDTANKPTVSFQQLFETFLEMYKAEREDLSEETSPVGQIPETSASGTSGSDQHVDKGNGKEEVATKIDLENVTSEQQQSTVQSQQVTSEGATKVLKELPSTHSDQDVEKDEGHRIKEIPTGTEPENVTLKQLQSTVQSQQVASEVGATDVLKELQSVHTHQHAERAEGQRIEDIPAGTEPENVTLEHLQFTVQSQQVASEVETVNVLKDIQSVHTPADRKENTGDSTGNIFTNIDTTLEVKPDEVPNSRTTVGIIKEEESEEKKVTHQETDIELDAPASSDAAQSSVSDMETKLFKSWKYKDNGLLYEMAYWFRFASKKYTEKMEDMTTKFASDYPEEIAMIVAYFLSEGDSASPSESILHSFKGTEWDSKVEYAKSLLKPKPKGDQSAPTMSDPVCKYCQVSVTSFPLFVRQDSTVPEGIKTARNIRYEFDFYVIFSEKDKEWVYYSLLQKLESNYGFKGAIPERDFIIGRDKLSEMARCMTTSFKILMLIRSHMDEFDSNKCVYQMNLAKEIGHTSKRQHYLIPVLLEDCCPPIQLSSLICVHAVDKYAWDKIVRSLEHR